MKLLSVGRARSIWLIHLVDLNPRGFNILSIIPPMIEKYKFIQYPSKPEELDLSKGVVFGNGSYQEDTQKNISVDLTIFNEAFVADTRSSTEDSDAFLEDFFKWLSDDFNLVPYGDIIRTNFYLSELWVKTDKALNSLNPQLESFANRMTALIIGHEHHPIQYETAGIIFWTNPNITYSPGPFRFERADNTPFHENRYYSAAPLQTDVHLEMLEELENILSK